MTYINCSAMHIDTLDFVRTKKQLKELIATRPHAVRLADVGGGPDSYSGPASNLPTQYQASVAGPDPFNNRRWFATISWVNHRLVVS